MTSSTTTDIPILRDRVAGLLGRPVLGLTPVAGGANSRVYRAETPDGPFAVKVYPMSSGDLRDRLGTETDAAAFLARNGVEGVPTLAASDRELGIATYGWIDGAPVGQAGASEIDEALGFLGTLHRLRHADGADDLPPASEACLSGEALTAQIDRRRARLLALPDAPRAFLEDEMATVFAAARIGLRAWSDAQGSLADMPLARSRRTLSPSDFGFHNALRRPDGRLAFLDFEYFGWDDPVKLTADFLLHPGMALDTAAKRRFSDGAMSLYGSTDPDFTARLAASMPLYALRWCMIILNEFLPERWEHRVRAGVAIDRAVVLETQLGKARGVLAAARAFLDGEPI